MKRLLFGVLFSLVFGNGFAQDQKSKDTCTVSLPNSAYRNPENEEWKDRLPVFFNCPTRDVEISVYDRWGQSLLQSAPLLNGKYVEWKYSQLKEGTYFWIIKCKELIDGVEVEKSFSGSITIVI